MAKKNLKRGLALGALMAFVITGSAMAADLADGTADGTSVANGDWTVSSNVTIDGPAKTVVGVVGDGGIANTITVADGVTFTAVSNGGGDGNCNGVIANTKIEGNGDIVLVSKGAYPASGLGQESVDSIKGNSISITSENGYGIYSSAAGESHTLEAKTITVTSDQHAVMANTSSNVTIKGFDELTLTADHEGSGVYSGGSSSVEIEGKNASINGDQRAAIAGESEISIKVDNLTATTQKINTSETDPRKNSVISANKDGKVTLEVSNKLVVNTNGQDGVNAINVEQGVIGIEGNPNTIQIDGDVKAESGKLTGFNVSGAESYVTGSINTGTNENAKIEFSNGATWTNTGASNVNDLTLNGGNIELGGDIVVTNLDGNGGTVNVSENDKNNTMTVNNNPNNTELDVRANDKYAEDIANMNDADRAEALEALAAQVVDGNEKTPATTVGAAQRDIAGEIIAEVKEDGTIGKAVEKIHAGNQAVTEANVNVKAMWRAHMNDMNKRMGELRISNGEHGVWVRMTRGEMSYKGDKAQYNQYQLGYDEKLSVNKAWTVGAAVTFAEGDSSFVNGGTDDKSTAFAIYGSKLNNDGTFIDLIARAAHMESDVTVSSKVGDYDANGYSVGAEFGKRIKNDNGCWIEPQVELTYGTVQESKFKLGDSVDVTMGDMDSFIGRLGFALGKDIKAGNVYARASYLYDFDGETDATYSNGKVTRPHESDLGGGWWEVGVGANINLSKATYVYADMEKTFGGELNTDWQWNLGVRYSF